MSFCKICGWVPTKCICQQLKLQRSNTKVTNHEKNACVDCLFYFSPNIDGYSEELCRHKLVAVAEFDCVNGWNKKIICCREYREEHHKCTYFEKKPKKWYQKLYQKLYDKLFKKMV